MAEQTSDKRKWATLLVLSLALAIIVIDTTLLNVSLGTIIREFNTTIQSIQWVITAYALTLAAFTITGGRLGDLFGRKRMFMFGAVIFAVGSFIASISHNVPTMVIGESIVEGIGAALMMPATSSLLISTFQGRDRAIAFGVWGGVAAAASALGPILGGYLTTHYSWRWGFRINVVVVALLLLGSYVIREARDTQEKPSLDWFGVILSCVGLLLVVFGIIEASTYGWWTAKEAFTFGATTIPTWFGLSITPFAIAAGLIFLAFFALWQKEVERSGNTPLVSLSLFANRQFTSGSVTTTVMSLGMSGLIFILPVFLQGVRGLDAFHTGLALLPMSITILIAAPLSGFLSTKIRPKYLIQLGLVLNLLGAIILRQSMSVDSTSASLVPGLLVFGAGLGMMMAQISNLTLSAVSVQQAGEASGVTNTMRQIGSTLGSAIIGAVLLSALATNLANGIQTSTVIPEIYKPNLTTVVQKQTSSIEFSGGAQLGSEIPQTITHEIKNIGTHATVDANKMALFYTALFALLGVFTSFFLPNIAVHGRGEKSSGPAAGH
jgi:EmrB/QacA subfamily drug resistance transporter